MIAFSRRPLAKTAAALLSGTSLYSCIISGDSQHQVAWMRAAASTFSSHTPKPLNSTGSTQGSTSAASVVTATTQTLVMTTHGTQHIQATWRKRLMAHAYNGVVTLAAQLFFVFLPGLLGSIFLPLDSVQYFLDTLGTPLSLGIVFYNGLIEQTLDTWPIGWGSENGQNVGMAWAGIKLIRYDEKPIDLKTMLWWWAGHAVAPINLGLGLISPSLGLDNTLSNTVVVEV